MKFYNTLFIISILFIIFTIVCISQEETTTRINKFKTIIDEILLLLEQNSANQNERLDSIELVLQSLNEIKKVDKNSDLNSKIEFIQSKVEQLRETNNMAELKRKDTQYLIMFFKILHKSSNYFPFKFSQLNIVDYEFILDEILDRTKVIFGNNKNDLVNAGIEARKWKLILNFYDGLNEININKDLEELNNYINSVRRMGYNSDEIEQAIWDTKSIEVELKYELGYYQQCISLTDEYFAGILESLTPDSQESHATIAALEAQGKKIRSIRALLKKSQGNPSENEVMKSNAIQAAVDLLAFEDSHSYRDANIDI